MRTPRPFRVPGEPRNCRATTYYGVNRPGGSREALCTARRHPRATRVPERKDLRQERRLREEAGGGRVHMWGVHWSCALVTSPARRVLRRGRGWCTSSVSFVRALWAASSDDKSSVAAAPHDSDTSTSGAPHSAAVAHGSPSVRHCFPADECSSPGAQIFF